MILHIKFTDGSNPYVVYGDKTKCKKAWSKWAAIKTARPLFICDSLQCAPVSGGGWAVARYFDGAHKTLFYNRLGNALNKLEGGVKQ